MAWAGDAFLCDSDRRSWGTWIESYHNRIRIRHRPGISLPSHMAGRSPIMTTRKRREKLDLGSSKLDQSSSTARRIYQSPVSPCTNPMRHATKCLVCRLTGGVVLGDHFDLSGFGVVMPPKLRVWFLCYLSSLR